MKPHMMSVSDVPRPRTCETPRQRFQPGLALCEEALSQACLRLRKMADDGAREHQRINGRRCAGLGVGHLPYQAQHVHQQLLEQEGPRIVCRCEARN